jgi:hypothetical protein
VSNFGAANPRAAARPAAPSDRPAHRRDFRRERECLPGRGSNRRCAVGRS